MGQYSAYVKRVKESRQTCFVCGEKFYGPEPERCCDGRECGCKGQPLGPSICSLECAQKHDEDDETTEAFTPKPTTDE